MKNGIRLKVQRNYKIWGVILTRVKSSGQHARHGQHFAVGHAVDIPIRMENAGFAAASGYKDIRPNKDMTNLYLECANGRGESIWQIDDMGAFLEIEVVLLDKHKQSREYNK